MKEVNETEGQFIMQQEVVDWESVEPIYEMAVTEKELSNGTWIWMYETSNKYDGYEKFVTKIRNISNDGRMSLLNTGDFYNDIREKHVFIIYFNQ
jgi:chloramphenicol O-acetyltransferase